MAPLFENNLSSAMASPIGSLASPSFKLAMPRAQPTQVSEAKSGVLVLEALDQLDQIIIPRQKCYLSVFRDARSKAHYAIVMPFRALFTRAEPLCVIDLRNSTLDRSSQEQLKIRVKDQQQVITFTLSTCKELDRFYGLASSATTTIESWIEALSNSQDALKSRSRRSHHEPVSVPLPMSKSKKQSLSLGSINETLEEEEEEEEEESEMEEPCKTKTSTRTLTGTCGTNPKPLSRRSSLEIIYESSEEDDYF